MTCPYHYTPAIWPSVLTVLLLIQNRNFDGVLARRDRWMGPSFHRERDDEALFVRFYDFDPDGLLTFNVVTLHRRGAGAWTQSATATRLWPQRRDELTAALEDAGFGEVTCWGDMQESPFDPQTSPNLVVTARRRDAVTRRHGDGFPLYSAPRLRASHSPCHSHVRFILYRGWGSTGCRRFR